MTRNFRELLEARWTEGKSVCVGLDSEYEKIPKRFQVIEGAALTMYRFNCEIIEKTSDIACAYKPNVAFYEAQGNAGMGALLLTIQYINKVAPQCVVILDAKRADIGNTNDGYAKAAFAVLGADAITVHPYLGGEALKPFLRYEDKGVFVLCKTSNPGSGEFQDLTVDGSKKLYQIVARNVAQTWDINNNCGLVVGATYPAELEEVRGIVGDMPILIPGVGTQGGDVEKTVKAGKNSRGSGMLINSSRGIIFADNPRQAALDLHSSIQSFL